MEESTCHEMVIYLPQRISCMLYFCCVLYALFDGEEKAGCFALFVFLVSRDCWLALPHNATGLSAVCERGIS